MSRHLLWLPFVVFRVIADRIAGGEDAPLLQLHGLDVGPQHAKDSDFLLVEYLEHLINEAQDHMQEHGSGGEGNGKLIEELTKSLESEAPAVHEQDGERTFYMIGDTNPTRAKRNVVEDVPCEFMARFDLASPTNEGMRVNGTHLWLPYEPIKGTFAKHNNVIDSSEFGVVHWEANKQDVSILGPRVKFGVMEKLHTLTHNNLWPTATLDRNTEILARRSNITNLIAKKLHRRRAFLSVAAASLYPDFKDVAVMDPSHRNATREFVELNGGSPEAVFSEKGFAMSAFMKRQRRKAEELRAEPSSSSLNCHHFEETSGVHTTATGVWVPLNRKILSYNGQAHFIPNARFGYFVGPGVWRHIQAENTVEYYLAGTSCFEGDSQEFQSTPRRPAMLYLSPPDLGDGVVGPDRRLPSRPLGQLAAVVQKMASAIPLDFYWLYESHETLCPSQVREKHERDLASIDFRSVASMQTRLLYAKYMADAVDCASPALSTDIPYSTGFAGIETTFFLHLMLEAPPVKRLRALSMTDFADSTLS